jgi:hypothetical protein
LLGMTSGNWATVEDLLEQAHGDVRHALELSKQKICPHSYCRSIGSSLGDCGMATPDGISFTAYGSAPNGVIRVWLPDTQITDKPDFTLHWQDVFEYVLYHSERDLTKQLRMFNYRGAVAK